MISTLLPLSSSEVARYASLLRTVRPLLALAVVLASAAIVRAAPKPEATEMEASAAASQAVQAPVFISPSDLDYGTILPEPPKPGSLAGRADLEAVIQAQEWRGKDEIAWAKRIAKIDIFHSADVLGPWFTKANLPALAKLVEDLSGDLHGVSAEVKKRFSRARPYVVDPTIRPCVPLPSNDSYPSGHTLRFFVYAHVLAELLPARKAELFKFAHREAWGRVWGGVHFPSDLVGGWLLADAVAARLKLSEPFRARLEVCRAEMDAAEKARSAR